MSVDVSAALATMDAEISRLLNILEREVGKLSRMDLPDYDSIQDAKVFYNQYRDHLSGYGVVCDAVSYLRKIKIDVRRLKRAVSESTVTPRIKGNFNTRIERYDFDVENALQVALPVKERCEYHLKFFQSQSFLRNAPTFSEMRT